MGPSVECHFTDCDIEVAHSKEALIWTGPLGGGCDGQFYFCPEHRQIIADKAEELAAMLPRRCAGYVSLQFLTGPGWITLNRAMVAQNDATRGLVKERSSQAKYRKETEKAGEIIPPEVENRMADYLESARAKLRKANETALDAQTEFDSR